MEVGLNSRTGTVARMMVVTIAALLVIAPLAIGGKQGTKIFDMFGQKMVKPETIFLTANSGPYLDELEWKDWGEFKASAEGVLVSDCASCAPPERRAARVVLRKHDKCKAKGGFSYRKGKIYSTDENGDPARRPLDTGFVYCRPDDS